MPRLTKQASVLLSCFRITLEPTRVEHLSGLPVNIRLGCKGSLATNTPAYISWASVDKGRNFLTLAYDESISLHQRGFLTYSLSVSWKVIHKTSFDHTTMEVLLKWKTQYGWPPCAILTVLSCISLLFVFSTKQPTLMRRSTVLSLPPQLVFPGPTTHFRMRLT